MLKKFKTLTDKYAIAAAFIVFILIDLLLLGLGQLFSLLPQTLPIKYLIEAVFVVIPVAAVFLLGFSSAFKRGKFFRGLLCCLPFIVGQLFALAVFFFKNLGNPEISWNSWYMIVYGMVAVVGIGIREECIYRATVQNIVAKKYANSIKGIWITVSVGAIIFGLSHIPNLFFGMEPLAVLGQVLSATFAGLLFGAVYLRSGSLWALVLIHTLTDTVSLAGSTFLNSTQIEDMNQLSFSWESIILWAAYAGLTAFLLRPSKSKQIYESLCFTGEDSKTPTSV